MGELPYKNVEDARQDILIKPKRRLTWAWLELYLTPKRFHLKQNSQR